jgi:hypothetical protein
MAGDKQGDPIIRIPKPFTLGMLFGSLPERYMEWLRTNDNEQFKRATKQLAKSVGPNLIPTVMQPIFENAANYSFFKEQPLESARMQAYPKNMRHNVYTSELAKFASDTVGYWSPIKWDNFFRGWSASLGTTINAGLTKAIRKYKGEYIGKDDLWKDVPGVGAFIAREPTGGDNKYSDDFYRASEMVKQAETVISYFKKTNQREELAKFIKDGIDGVPAKKLYAMRNIVRRYSLALADLRWRQYRVMYDKSLSNAEKQKRIDNIKARQEQLLITANRTFRKQGVL